MKKGVLLLKEAGNRIWQDIKKAIIPFMIFVGYNILVKFLFKAFCPMVIVSGLPCPGCGITRALWYFLTGDFKAAYQMNPTIYIWILVGTWFCINRYLLGRRMPWANGILLISGIIMLVVYGIRMAYQFPTHPPMTYMYENILTDYIPQYPELLKRVWQL